MAENSKDVAGDIVALLRARNPLIWIVTTEEARVEGYIVEAAAAANMIPRTWDTAAGIRKMDGKQDRDGDLDPSITAELGYALAAIQTRAEKPAPIEGNRGLWIMRDVPPWLEGPIGLNPMRRLRNLARFLPKTPRDCAQAIIILSPRSDVPPELSNHATVIEWPLPDRGEIAAILDANVRAVIRQVDKSVAEIEDDDAPEIAEAIKKFLNGAREPAIDAAVGLSAEEAAACYARSLVQKRCIDPAIVSQEKKRVIAKAGVLEWFDPLPGGLDAVGGLDVLKKWLVSRRLAYTAKAREYGLPAPRGAFLVGISGCGKSLISKAIATAWGVPLLKLDLGALQSKFVGESQANIRKAFRTIEAIGRCVVWLDEVEKALAGATQGAADGGVSADALGTILTWMQERKGESFVIATSNDVTQLPPELLRKGRFDEMWWVDLPTRDERGEIAVASLKAHGRTETMLDFDAIINATEGFTGSEIAALVPDALFTAFADDGREIETRDLLAAAKTVVPLSKTKKETIDKQRAWAQERARFATSAQAVEVAAARRQEGRAIEL